MQIYKKLINYLTICFICVIFNTIATQVARRKIFPRSHFGSSLTWLNSVTNK